MAKQQTFGDKLKKKKQVEVGVNVKVIKGFRTDEGNMRFVEKFVRVQDVSEIAKIDFNK